jgi:hypothetical protein
MDLKMYISLETDSRELIMRLFSEHLDKIGKEVFLVEVGVTKNSRSGHFTMTLTGASDLERSQDADSNKAQRIQVETKPEPRSSDNGERADSP